MDIETILLKLHDHSYGLSFIAQFFCLVSSSSSRPIFVIITKPRRFHDTVKRD